MMNFRGRGVVNWLNTTIGAVIEIFTITVSGAAPSVLFVVPLYRSKTLFDMF